jgi:lipoprotein-releasing system permease protein
MRYEFWLGLRYLFAKRRERFISIIAVLSIGGVALGVAALITVLSVMSGFDHDITDKLVSINAHLVVDAPEGVRNADELMQQLSAMEHVVGVAPFVAGQVILRLPNQAFGVIVRGIDPERDARISRLNEFIVLGRLPQSDDEVVIGTELSAYLGAGRGDELKLISPADGKTSSVTISGIFRSGMYDYDANLIALTIPRAQALYHLENVVSGLGVRLDRLDEADAVKARMQAQLGPAYNVRTWMELNPALFGALRVEKIVMFVILTLIVVVAALNIVSMLIMIVMEKTKDIGILRVLGATNGSIALLFLSQGCTVGLLGIALGLAGGVALAGNLNNVAAWMERTFGVAVFPPSVYYLDQIPTQIHAPDVVRVAAAAFLLTALAGTYAAVRAARLQPVDALRYE